MLTGAEVVTTLQAQGVTHVVWIPDSVLGTWNAALAAAGTPRLVRVTREGEAFAIAAGLYLGGARPLIAMQCTGLFEAGDALRNFIHDLGLPLVSIIGLRGQRAHQAGTTADTCPRFSLPILTTWQLPYTLMDPIDHTGTDLGAALAQYYHAGQAGAVVLVE
jgi:sulfopyruvate decarboxylase TPP-binding subunit